MSDGQKLKDCIELYRQSNKKLDETLKRIEAEGRQNRRESKGQSSRQH